MKENEKEEVTFLIKHKDLFTYDKEQKIFHFYYENNDIAIGQKKLIRQYLEKFSNNKYGHDDEIEIKKQMSKYKENDYIAIDKNRNKISVLPLNQALQKYVNIEQLQQEERSKRKADKYISGTIESGYDNYLSVEEAADELEQETLEPNI